MNDIESVLRRSSGGPVDPPPFDLSAAEAAGVVDVAYARHDSPVGSLLLAATAQGLVCVRYVDGSEGEAAVLSLLARTVSPRVLAAPRRLDRPRAELDEFFAGRRREFELALDGRLIGTPFARRVLRATAAIPFGATASYREMAAAAGSPNAFRAAGTALGHNPLPIVIPCHRVVPSGGGLGQYTGGTERKRTLLAVEAG